MKLRDIGEFGWIRRVREASALAGKGVLAGIGDDAAWLKTSPTSLLTCDLLVEDVHFIRDTIPPRLLGRKALSVNLSDIAAMAAIPDFALWALGLPADIELDYLDGLLEGFLEVAAEHKLEVIGGDTSASPLLMISVTVLGHPSRTGPVLRSGAKPGDDIWVTGTLGDASLGFELLKKTRDQELEISELHYSSLIVRHFDPKARIEPGLKLGPLAHSMIDVSDGIMNDLSRILEESGKKQNLRAVVHLDKIPLSDDFNKFYGQKPLRSRQALSLALSGGEDYELLFTASPGARAQIVKAGVGLDLNITRIGKIEKAKNREIILVDRKGRKVAPPRLWFEHFPRQERDRN